MSKELTAEMARQLLTYIPETGELIWKRPPGRKIKAGAIAGTVSRKRGERTAYISVMIYRKHYRAHRLAWLITHGRWPTEFIDHINGNGLDNRLCNLREATRAQNKQNAPCQSNSRTGLKGVVINKLSGKFTARIGHFGRSLYLGTFDTPEDAHKAYRDAADILHGEFANYGDSQ